MSVCARHNAASAAIGSDSVPLRPSCVKSRRLDSRRRAAAPPDSIERSDAAVGHLHGFSRV